MKVVAKGIISNLRLQYYVPFVLLSGYLLWYPTPKKVSANQAQDSLPVLNSDPGTWPKSEPISSPEPNLPAEPDLSIFSSDDSGFEPTVPISLPQNLNPPPPITLPPVTFSLPSELDQLPPSNAGNVSSPIEPPSIINPYQPDEYRLAIGDSISIFVANVPEFTTENIIESDGKINLPVAGPIYLWDMTVEEAEVAVTQRYVNAKVLQKPDISIKRLASSPLKIAIAGKINRPGAYDLAVLDKKLPTITEALKAAGGIASEADLRNVQIYRHNRTGGQDLITLNLFALYDQADLSQNITLRSGDRIIIPEATIRPEEAKLVGSANVSPDTMQIGLLGEVLSPGIIQSPTNTSLNQALILVGGLNNRATKKIELVRTNDDGTVMREKIKIDWSANVGDPSNPVLHHRDVVLVGRNAITKYSDFLENAIGPINRTVPFIGILDLLFPGRQN